MAATPPQREQTMRLEPRYMVVGGILAVFALYFVVSAVVSAGPAALAA